MKPAIKAMRDWLLTCPLFEEQLGEFGTLRMNFLGPDPVQFSIEDSPTDPVLQRYFSGARKAKNYALTSRMEFTESQTEAAANSGFFDQLCAWIDLQNEQRNLPRLDGGLVAEAVAVNTSGYIIQTTSSTCKFQLQLQLQYYQPKGALIL
ncbi:MAG: hypothetical protein IJ347_09485 [Faecalibacterium sp.]|nr:hypothetical protein [Faecalibacterium sp.]